MSRERVYESPRVTKPYTDEQWRRDRRARPRASTPTSQQHDVRLTMGGEPTFVSVDDRDGAEWNTERARPDQAPAAPAQLLAAASQRATRAAASCTSARASGIRASSCRAGRSAATGAATASRRGTTRAVRRRDASPTGHGRADAARFVQRARDAPRRRRRRTCRPAYEDVWYYLWRERRLPVNVDPFDARLDDELERARLRARLQRRGSTRSSATRCRSSRDERRGARWRTGPWFLRDERMYLIPGDSPMGYRLPLDSLPWAARGRSSADRAAATRSPCGRRCPRTTCCGARAEPIVPMPRPAEPSARDRVAAPLRRSRLARAVRNRRAASCAPRSASSRATACCTSSCRRVDALEDYLELVAAVEATAAALSTAGAARRLSAADAIRGSRTSRSRPIPASSRSTSSRRAAGTSWSSTPRRSTRRRGRRASRTEKFMLDGRHTGTGGGNHFVLGGADRRRQPVPAPARSAAQPASATGTTIRRSRTCSPGSSSARPARRRASTRRATTASTSSRSPSRQLPRARAATTPPWLVDRLFRNLLVDVTGNTHRAEFCIDKLYSPDTAPGASGCSSCAPSRCRRTRG